MEQTLQNCKFRNALSLKAASVGGDRLLSSDAAIVPTVSGDSVRTGIFRASLGHKHSPLRWRILLNTPGGTRPFPSLVLDLRDRGRLETWLLYVLLQRMFISHVSSLCAPRGGDGLS